MRLLIIFDCVEDVDITVVSAQSGSAELQFSTLRVGVRGPHGFTASYVTCTISWNQQNEVRYLLF